MWSESRSHARVRRNGARLREGRSAGRSQTQARPSPGGAGEVPVRWGGADGPGPYKNGSRGCRPAGAEPTTGTGQILGSPGPETWAATKSADLARRIPVRPARPRGPGRSARGTPPGDAPLPSAAAGARRDCRSCRGPQVRLARLSSQAARLTTPNLTKVWSPNLTPLVRRPGGDQERAWSAGAPSGPPGPRARPAGAEGAAGTTLPIPPSAAAGPAESAGSLQRPPPPPTKPPPTIDLLPAGTRNATKSKRARGCANLQDSPLRAGRGRENGESGESGAQG